jgi:hypothetical protein
MSLLSTSVTHFFQIPLVKASQTANSLLLAGPWQGILISTNSTRPKKQPTYLKLFMDKLFGDMADDVIHYARTPDEM